MLQALRGAVTGHSRLLSSATVSTMPWALRLVETVGKPQEVLSLVQEELPARLQHDEVLLDILAAPINPSDVNAVEGRYPIKLPVPGGVPGFEGVARVREAGAKAGFAPGDWLIPRASGQGTWRQAGVFKAGDWHRVPNTIPVEAAATLFVNPPTALRMLEEYVALQPGDSIVQNGANSAVGQYVCQMAKAMGVSTVNVVRDRPGGLDKLAADLQALGGTLVTTEARLREDLERSGLPRPKLALNCVGGSASAAVAKALAHGGTMVTYGGMSMQPVSVPTSLFIFRDITCRGFWLSNPDREGGGPEQRLDIVDRIASMYVRGELQPNSVQGVPLEQYKQAFECSYEGFTGAKLIFLPNPQLAQRLPA